MKNILLIIILSLLISCTNHKDKDTINNNSGNTIYKDKLTVNYSKNFKIEYSDSIKIITVFSSDSLKKVMAIYILAGENIKTLPVIQNSQLIRTPIKSVAVLRKARSIR